MLVRHVDASCLRPILDSKLTPDFKFQVALGKLQQQKPLTASLLKFHIDVLRGRCPLTCAQRDALYGDDLAAALNHPDMRYLIPTLRCCVIFCFDCAFRRAAAVGKLEKLPEWLEG